MKEKESNSTISRYDLWSMILIGALCLEFLAFLFLPPLLSDNNIKPNKSETSATTAPTIEISTATMDETTVPMTSETESTSPVEEELPEELAAFLERGGYTAESLTFDQLIVVDSSGTYATVSFYEKNSGKWDLAEDLITVNGYVGTMGVSPDANENASYTPAGMYGIGTGFGIMDDPGAGISYIKVTEDSYWVDDPNSKFYNQYIEGTEDKDWNSAEHLASCIPEYNYAAFIEYNVNPTVAGKGSAFFLHVGTSPTAGCVAIPEDSMIAVLRWMNASLSPHILIL